MLALMSRGLLLTEPRITVRGDFGNTSSALCIVGRSCSWCLQFSIRGFRDKAGAAAFPRTVSLRMYLQVICPERAELGGALGGAHACWRLGIAFGWNMVGKQV